MEPTTQRHILHIDMNAFYCACHAASEPAKYRGRPTAVAGSPETRHGVVVTASYEARRLGVRAPMTVAEALRIYPRLILIHPDFALYRKYSRAVFAIIGDFTPDLEIFSIDECFADVTHSKIFGTPVEIARQIQQRIAQELDLPCSIGVAPNKFLAKMASDMKKPRGLTVIMKDDVQAKLWPLPVEQMFGIGKQTAEKLHQRQIHTIGDLAHTPRERLAKWFGKRGPELADYANGMDDRPVSAADESAKSIGHSITLPADEQSEEALQLVLMNLSDQVGRRLRRHRQSGRTIQVTIRYANRETLTRSRTLPHPTDLTEDIYQQSVRLLQEHRDRGRAVRLLGVTIQGLGPVENEEPVSRQLSLFEAEQPTWPEVEQIGRKRKLASITDALRDKYGDNIVIRGRMLLTSESNGLRDHRSRGTSLQKDWLTDKGLTGSGRDEGEEQP